MNMDYMSLLIQDRSFTTHTDPERVPASSHTHSPTLKENIYIQPQTDLFEMVCCMHVCSVAVSCHFIKHDT